MKEFTVAFGYTIYGETTVKASNKKAAKNKVDKKLIYEGLRNLDYTVHNSDVYTEAVRR